MLIRRKDPFTGLYKTLDLDITQDQIDRWRAGEFIQDVMPNLTPSQREFLITGISNESWDKHVVNQDLPPESNKIEKFLNNVFSKSNELNSFDDLEKLIHDRNRSKINSILNPKRD